MDHGWMDVCPAPLVLWSKVPMGTHVGKVENMCSPNTDDTTSINSCRVAHETPRKWQLLALRKPSACVISYVMHQSLSP